MPKPTGRRKITPAINTTMAIAEQWNTQTAIDKTRAAHAFRCASHLLHLNAQAIELMNKLLSFSQEQDWTGDTRPLVWPDNLRLVGECTFGLAALRRNLRRLAEVGLISFHDSPKGQRYGKRDKNGKIVLTSSYGIDLSPLGLKVPELEARFEVDKAEKDELRILKRRFTSLRKLVSSIIEAATGYCIDGPWAECADRLSVLVAQRHPKSSLGTLRDLCGKLDRLLERARTAYCAASDAFPNTDGEFEHCEEIQFKRSKMRPMGVHNDTLIQNTIQHSKSFLYKKTQSEFPNIDSVQTMQKKNSEKKEERRRNHGEAEKILAKPVDAKTLLVLCPDFKQFVWAPDGVTWREIVQTAENVVKTYLEIPDSTWKSAVRLLGREQAAVAVALIFEKHNAGLITSAGAYLNGMITKTQKGQLALSSSLFHWRNTSVKHSLRN